MELLSIYHLSYLDEYIKQLQQEDIYSCEVCGDYEYCAGHFDDEKCTGFISN